MEGALVANPFSAASIAAQLQRAQGAHQQQRRAWHSSLLATLRLNNATAFTERLLARAAVAAGQLRDPPPARPQLRALARRAREAPLCGEKMLRILVDAAALLDEAGEERGQGEGGGVAGGISAPALELLQSLSKTLEVCVVAEGPLPWDIACITAAGARLLALTPLPLLEEGGTGSRGLHNLLLSFCRSTPGTELFSDAQGGGTLWWSWRAAQDMGLAKRRSTDLYQHLVLSWNSSHEAFYLPHRWCIQLRPLGLLTSHAPLLDRPPALALLSPGSRFCTNGALVCFTAQNHSQALCLLSELAAAEEACT
jgi:hypothetical protein